MRVNASNDAITWAQREFGHAVLGDARRTERLVAMGACACERPDGKVSAVFNTHKEREGAYDFLESKNLQPQEVIATVTEATCRRSVGQPFVFIATDGTSLKLVDHAGEKDFGRIGADTFGARGLKVIDALAVSPDGVPLGWLALTYWARSSEPKSRPPAQGTHARRKRAVDEKETRYWLETIEYAKRRLDEHGLRGWFKIDREADGHDLLLALDATGHWWTVRSNADRSVLLDDGDTGRLRSQLGAQQPQATIEIEAPARAGRPARTAQVEVRVGRVQLRLRDRRTNRRTPLAVTAVWVHEARPPSGVARLDWLLFTNYEVSTLDDALLVVRGYATRWRVEECHRTWKSGCCDVEQTQLQSFAAVQAWATILATVATRIERLKRLARTQPEAPATLELTPIEVRALVLLRRHHYRRQRVPDAPTIAQAVLWLAELGGYIGPSSGKPPGTTTISRGLDRLAPAAQALEAMDRTP